MAYLIKMKNQPYKNFLLQQGHYPLTGVLLKSSVIESFQKIKVNFISYNALIKNTIKKESISKKNENKKAFLLGKNKKIEDDIFSLLTWCIDWHLNSEVESKELIEISMELANQICCTKEQSLMSKQIIKNTKNSIKNYLLVFIHLNLPMLESFSDRELKFLKLIEKKFMIKVFFEQNETKVVVKTPKFSFSFLANECDFIFLLKKLENYIIENEIEVL